MSLLKVFSKRPKYLGVKEGKLAKCPVTPNCVSSQTKSKFHFIEPINFPAELNFEAAKNKLKNQLSNNKNAHLITEESDYLYYEFMTPFVKFIDDVEFYFNQAKSHIDVRSASRLGTSDFGANRKRIEMIRDLIKQ